jgi:hypothetical protein
MGAKVTLEMPDELTRLARTVAPIERGDAELCVPMFDVMTALALTPRTIPAPPYLAPDPILIARWRSMLGPSAYPRFGIAWSTRFREPERSMAIDALLDLIDADGAEIVSLQAHGQDEAAQAGVIAPDYADFADVAAVASLMDTVVSVDTGALNVAGAIGHPDVHAILPAGPNWRWWNGNPWYPAIKLHRQSNKNGGVP